MSGSTTPSRPRLSSRSQSRQTARSGSPVYFPASGVDPTDIVPDGPIIEDNADIIDDLIHRRPHVHREETAFEVEDEDEEEDDHDAVLDEQREQRRRLPWWKRANPWWSVVTYIYLYVETTYTHDVHYFPSGISLLYLSVQRPVSPRFRQGLPSSQILSATL